MAKGQRLHEKRRTSPHEATLPQITSLDMIETILPRYVWVDEDDNQVSPIHKELRSAFNFVNGWSDRWARIVEQYGDPTEEGTSWTGSVDQLTKSGKPPVKLKRVVINIKVDDVTEEEQRMAEIMMGEM